MVKGEITGTYNLDHFFEFVSGAESTKNCWLWIRPLTSNGYGTYAGSVPAHKWIYECLFGRTDKGLVMDHLCRVKNCVNPLHLEPVTHKENLYRGELPVSKNNFNKSKTFCIRGHEFNEENTITYSTGRRECRACKNLRYRNSKLPLQGQF